MTYPKIYLAFDNCVLYKRWTRPSEWMAVIKDLGVNYIEASADTELDPLYMGSSYLEDWIEQVKAAESINGVKVCNLYSGHGTYTTLGLTHTDERVRHHMIENWFYPMIKAAGQLGCGMGFFAHAFNHDILQNHETYMDYVSILVDALAQINKFARVVDCGHLGIEQMYTPHQYPWRKKDVEFLMKEVTAKSGRDFYFTEDVGHHHIKFLRPGRDELGKHGTWLGSDKAFRLAVEYGDSAWEAITSDMQMNPHLFSEREDGDCYRTIRDLGCYSPIIHLQQTNGTTSAHTPFTVDENREGIIQGELVLKSLWESYNQVTKLGMPAKVDEIFLTLELFSGTTSILPEVLSDCRESVKYWRQFIPEDGLPLDELLCGLAPLGTP